MRLRPYLAVLLVTAVSQVSTPSGAAPTDTPKVNHPKASQKKTATEKEAEASWTS